jgi:PAS domain S-box-containing protein
MTENELPKGPDASEPWFRAVVDASPVPMALNDEELRITFLNRTFTETFGYTMEELPTLAEWWPRAYPDPVYREQVAANWTAELDRAKRTATPFTPMEVQIRCKDGAIKTVLASAASFAHSFVGTHIAVLYDVTERRREEQALRESEERYRQLFNSGSDCVSLHDAGTDGIPGRFLEVNDVACRVLGYTRDELLAMTPRDILPPDLRAEVPARVRAVDAAGRATWESIFLTKDGRRFPVEIVSHRFYLAGRPVALATARDITERRRLEDDLRQAQKMESVGRLAGGVAHDFNNMLSVILGHAELALERLSPAEPLHADLLEIQGAASRSAELTRQLLAFARKQTVSPRVLDLGETVESMLKMLQRLIGEDIELRWDCSTKLWPVKIDPSQIDQILANLCINARDAIAGVGKMTIEASNAAIDDAYCATHAGFLPGDYVRLAVSDDGAGMDKETLSHLFEPFFTTKPLGAGTGLGLAMVYGIVKQNGGFIHVYSEPGHGTTFTIYVPRYLGGADAERRSGVASAPVRGRETILVVEDEPSILRLASRMLERQGYTVLTASTPGEALRVAHDFTGELHLLMTDVVMPEMNGRELAKRLLAHFPGLRRLFMSGYTANVIAHHGVLDDGVHFIQKPFSVADLAAKVRRALDTPG